MPQRLRPTLLAAVCLAGGSVVLAGCDSFDAAGRDPYADVRPTAADVRDRGDGSFALACGLPETLADRCVSAASAHCAALGGDAAIADQDWNYTASVRYDRFLSISPERFIDSLVFTCKASG